MPQTASPPDTVLKELGSQLGDESFIVVHENLEGFGLSSPIPCSNGVRRRDEAPQGRRRMRFAFPGGDYCDLFLDPRDGSCTWVREQHDTQIYWTRLGDWRTVSGVFIRFEQRTIHDDSKRDATVRWTAVTANQVLSAADFGKPAARAVSEIAGGLPSTP